MTEVEEVIIEWKSDADKADVKDVRVSGSFSNWDELSLSKYSEEETWRIRYLVLLCVI